MEYRCVRWRCENHDGEPKSDHIDGTASGPEDKVATMKEHVDRQGCFCGGAILEEDLKPDPETGRIHL